MNACYGDADGDYFDNLAKGVGCDSNWMAGALPGGGRPEFTEIAPALLGYDEAIAAYCLGNPSSDLPPPGWQKKAIPACIAANLNVLAIFDNEHPYSLCKNLEWQVCAALGRLPGQGSRTIRFATEPGGLILAEGPHPFGRCRGHSPKGCKIGYSSDDIYYLEICLFSQLCDNGEQLFHLEVGDDFNCKFSAARLNELKEVLFVPPAATNEAYGAEALSTCKGWCRGASCNRAECVGCGAERGCSPLTGTGGVTNALVTDEVMEEGGEAAQEGEER